MTTNQDNKPIHYPTNPTSYRWKGTISDTNDVKVVLAHCKDISSDVFIKIHSASIDDFESKKTNDFIDRIKILIQINHECLLTPKCVICVKKDIWVIYPCISGGPIDEIITSHYPTGLPNEKLIGCILQDIAIGLSYLHKSQACHRHLNGSSIYLSQKDGKSLLWGFDALKSVKWSHGTESKILTRNLLFFLYPEKL